MPSQDELLALLERGPLPLDLVETLRDLVGPLLGPHGQGEAPERHKNAQEAQQWTNARRCAQERLQVPRATW